MRSAAGIDMAVNTRWLSLEVDVKDVRLLNYRKATDDTEMIFIRWRHPTSRSFPRLVVTADIEGRKSVVFNVSDVIELIDDPNVVIPINHNNAIYTIEVSDWSGTLEVMIRRDGSRLMLENVESLIFTEPDVYTLGMPHEETAGIKIDLCGKATGQFLLTRYKGSNDKLDTTVKEGFIKVDAQTDVQEMRLSFIKSEVGLTMFKVTKYTDDDLKTLKSVSTIEMTELSKQRFTLRFNSTADSKYLDAILVGSNDYQSLDFRRKCGFDPVILDYAVAASAEEKEAILSKSVWNHFKTHSHKKLLPGTQLLYTTKSQTLNSVKPGNYKIENGYFTIKDKQTQDDDDIFVGTTMSSMRYFYIKVIDSSDPSHQPAIDSSKVVDRWQFDDSLDIAQRYLADSGTMNRLILILGVILILTVVCVIVNKCMACGDSKSKTNAMHRHTEIETIDHGAHSSDEDN